ncbi:MAG TPA: ParB/RepB/Spo0J family partition protein [Terriglobia bacterium]|nr:ParB/RepB/Spo0J family partition protein [Terriglobia bacterium]
MARKALGRGLSSLLREVEEKPAAGLEQIALDSIDPNPFQPRRAFREESLKELSESIRASGVVQPVLLRHASGSAGRYHLIAGERRWRAARLAGLEAVPAIIRDINDQDALELALTENLLREDLNTLEVAHAYEALQQKFGLNHGEIADRLGINRSTVTNTLRLLRLSPSVQEMIGNGEISPGHARALLGFDSFAAQEKLARLIVHKGLSVRQIENMGASTGAKPDAGKAKAPPAPDPNTRAAVLELERALGTRVKIVGYPKRGKIEISYFSAEDLNRIYDWIVRR